MSIPHQSTPRSAPAFVLVSEATQNVPAILSIIQGKESCWYYVSSLPAAWGQCGFRFEKYGQEEGSDPEADGYDVLLDGEHSLCHCKGFLRWGHCKHIAAADWLVNERGYVPPLLGTFVPAEEPPPEPVGESPTVPDPDADDPVGLAADLLAHAGVTRGDCADCGGTGVTPEGDCGTCHGWGSVQAAEWWAGRRPAPVSYLPELEENEDGNG